MASQATASAPLPIESTAPVVSQAHPETPPRQVSLPPKYHSLPASTAAAQRDLLIMQARCKVAGQDMDAEFERVRQVLDHYFHLLREMEAGSSAPGIRPA